MSFWVESGWVDKGGVTASDITSTAPEDVLHKIITFEEGLGKSRRDLCEAIGVGIARDPEWGSRVLDALQVNVHKLPLDAINPILWGIRAKLTDNTIKIDEVDVVAFLDKFGSMVERGPNPTMWTSLPSLLQNLVARFPLPIESWNELAIRLGSIFEAFDYERNEDDKPIEWRHRAINHPYGDTTELYLTLAQQQVKVLSEAGKPLALESHAESFFSHMVAHYDLGSRYGLCLLAPWLSWIEAVSPKLADSLYPLFEWVNGEERAVVMWSGYLWSNTLSRRLVQNFESSYISAGKRQYEFASEERRGLGNHVSAVFWFHPDRIDLLYQFASVVDSQLRVGLLHGWKGHLGKAHEESVKRFFDTIVFPYWDWCTRQDFFSGDNADNERFAFWELVPISLTSFPEACRRAIQERPSKVVHLGLFVQDAVNDSTLRYPNELVELLITLLEFDPYPRWQEKDWRRSWYGLKGTGAKKLNELENALARRGIDLIADK